MKKTALKAILLLIVGTQLDASDLLECEGGDALACYELAKLNSEKYENIKAAIFFEKSCEGGYAPACTKLAEKYLYGVGVVGSRDKAVALYDKGCEEGDGEACYVSAGFYDYGEGADKLKSIKYHEKGCMNTYASSCLILGHETKEIRWYEKAKDYFTEKCDQGDGESCFWLGSIYESGWGVEKDEAKAETMFSKARGLGYSI